MELTPTQERILGWIALGMAPNRQARALIPMEQAGLIVRFKRDYLLKTSSPTIWRLTLKGKETLLNLIKKKAPSPEP